MTRSLQATTRSQVPEEYDDRARWLDDTDDGDRWRHWAACKNQDPALFFPVVYERKQIRNEDGTVEIHDVPTDEEPAYPPPNVKAICDRCPVRGRCLVKFMTEDVGVFGGTTGYQRRLMNKKIVRKRCLSCGSTDCVKGKTEKTEICLACGTSWDII